MALRSLAGKLAEKLKGLLPLRAEPPRPAAFDLEKEIAGLQNPLYRDIAKTIAEETRLICEEADECVRRYNRDTVLIAATGVVISGFAISGIIKNLEELHKGKLEIMRKAMHSQQKGGDAAGADMCVVMS